MNSKKWLKYRNPNELYDYVLEQTKDMSKQYYVMIDEIQLSFKVKNTDIVRWLSLMAINSRGQMRTVWSIRV